MPLQLHTYDPNWPKVFDLEAKRMGTLRELVPAAGTIAALVNPKNPNAITGTREAQEAARTLGLRLQFVNAGTEREIDTAFATLVQGRVEALVVI